MLISIVVPIYNEEPNIREFRRQTAAVLAQIPDSDYEIIFVNDGSSDGSLRILKELSSQDDRIRYVSFSRNFGKEAAMIAGFEYTSGDLVAVMDVDLQDPPEMLKDMYRILTESNGEYDCVAARRTSREGEPPVRSFFARFFYKLINKISKTPIVDGARDFRLMTRQMVDAIISLPEYNRFSKGLFQWVGFNTYWLPYQNVERYAGTTKWSFSKLFLYSIDGFVAFSTVPLAISSVLGVIISFIAFLLGIYFMLQKLIFGNPVAGYPSLIVVSLMLGGIQLLAIGVLGQYLSKTYLEVKGRPRYVVKETKNLKKKPHKHDKE